MSRHNLGPRSTIRGINSNAHPGNFSQVEYITEIYRSCTTPTSSLSVSTTYPQGTRINPLKFALFAISSHIVFRGSPPYPHRDIGGMLQPLLLSPITVDYIDDMNDMKELIFGQDHGVDVIDQQRNRSKISQLTAQHCTSIIHANFHPHVLENRILSLDNPFITPFVQQYISHQLQEHFLPPQFLQNTIQYHSPALSTQPTPPKQITDTTTLQNEQYYSHLTAALHLDSNSTSLFPHFYEPTDNICDMIRSERERALFALEHIKSSNKNQVNSYEELFNPSSEPLLRVISIFGEYSPDPIGAKQNDPAQLLKHRNSSAATNVAPFPLLNHQVAVHGSSFELNTRLRFAIERTYKQYLLGQRVWKFKQHLLHYLPLPKEFLSQLHSIQSFSGTPSSQLNTLQTLHSQGNFIDLINKNSIQQQVNNKISTSCSSSQLPHDHSSLMPGTASLPHVTFLELPSSGNESLTLSGVRHLVARDSAFIAIVPSMLLSTNNNTSYEIDPLQQHLCSIHNMTYYLPTDTAPLSSSTPFSTNIDEEPFPLSTHATFFNTKAIEIQLFTPFPYHVPSQSFNTMILPNYQPPLQVQIYGSFTLLQVSRQTSFSRYSCMDSIDRSGKMLSFVYPTFIELLTTYLNNIVQFSPLIFDNVLASSPYQKEIESIPYLIHLTSYIREYFILHSLGIDYHPQLHFSTPLSLSSSTSTSTSTSIPLPPITMPHMQYQSFTPNPKVLQVLYDQNVQLMQQLARLVTQTFLLFKPSFALYQAAVNKLQYLFHSHGSTDIKIIQSTPLTSLLSSTQTQPTTSSPSLIPPVLYTTAHQTTSHNEMYNYFIYHRPTYSDPLDQPSVYHYTPHQTSNISHIFYKDNYAGFANLSTFNSLSYNLTLARKQKQLEIRSKGTSGNNTQISNIVIEPQHFQLSCALQQMAIINPHSLHCFANISPPIYQTPVKHTLEYHYKPAFPHIFLTNTSVPTVNPATLTYDPITNPSNSISFLNHRTNLFSSLINLIISPIVYTSLQIALFGQYVASHQYFDHLRRRYADVFDFSRISHGLSIFFTTYRPTRGLLPLQGFMVKQLPTPPPPGQDPNQPTPPQPPAPPRYGLFPIYENKLTPNQEIELAQEQLIRQHEQEQSSLSSKHLKLSPTQFSPQQLLRFQSLKAANPKGYNKDLNPYTNVAKWLPIVAAFMTVLIAFTFLWVGPLIMNIPDLRNTSPLSPRFDDLHNSTLPTLLLAPPSESYKTNVISSVFGPIPTHFDINEHVDPQYHRLILDNGPSALNNFIHNTLLSPFNNTPLQIQKCVIEHVSAALTKQRSEVQQLITQFAKIQKFNNAALAQGKPLSNKSDTSQHEAQLKQHKDHLTSGKHLLFSLLQHQFYGQIDFINLSLLSDTVLYRDCNTGSLMTPEVLSFIDLNTPQYTKITFSHYESLPVPQSFIITPSTYTWSTLITLAIVPTTILTIIIYFLLFNRIKDDIRIQSHWFTPPLEFSAQLHQPPKLQPPPPERH